MKMWKIWKGNDRMEEIMKCSINQQFKKNKDMKKEMTASELSKKTRHSSYENSAL